MSKQTFTDEPPVMDPDKPVQCLWFVMYRMIDGFMAWGGRAVDDVRSEGPFEDRDAAVKGAEKLGTSGYQNCHVLAIVPAIFQEGDYVKDYKPYEKPTPIGFAKSMVDDLAALYDANQNRHIDMEPMRIVNDIELRAVRVPLPQHLRYFYNEPEPAPAVVVRPGDGIAKALEAKVEGIRRSARIQDRIPGQEQGRSRRVQKEHGITVQSHQWTGRKGRR